MKKTQNLVLARTSAAKKLKLQEGVVLLEALIAIVLFSIGILAIVGLQAAMIKNTSDNKYRSDASFIAQERIGQMWADPGNLANYYETATSVADLLPNGTRTVVAEPTGRGLVTVTVTWQAPGGDAHQYATSTYIGAL
jgi:type IV pilus assembly protein PilV